MSNDQTLKELRQIYVKLDKVRELTDSLTIEEWADSMQLEVRSRIADLQDDKEIEDGFGKPEERL